MPDQEDRFIMALGLGSSGHDYTSLNGNPPTIPTARPQPRPPAAPYRPQPLTPAAPYRPQPLPPAAPYRPQPRPPAAPSNTSTPSFRIRRQSAICQQNKQVCHGYTVSPGECMHVIAQRLRARQLILHHVASARVCLYICNIRPPGPRRGLT